MRCYFQLVNSHETVADDTGIKVSDLTTARHLALQAIDEIQEEALQVAASWQGGRLDVVCPAGPVLLSIPLEPILH